MPCDNNCKSYLKAVKNATLFGHRVMIGEEFCQKERRKLTADETESPMAPIWCPNDVDKERPAKAASVKPSAAKPKKVPAAPPVPAAIPQKSTAPAAKSKTGRVQELVALLNQYRNEYYNKNAPSVTDEVYDSLFNELRQLEAETGFVMSNSPTQTVGFKPVSELSKVKHPIPLLSLDDTKDIGVFLSFAQVHHILLMHKLDGLTVELEYENGELLQASTRGDGNEGEDITHNVPAISGIPQKIPYTKRLVVVGEAYICGSDFNYLKDILLDSTGKPYKNARNLAAGSVRCFNPAECVKRLVRFVPFNVKEGLNEDPDMANSKATKLNHITAFGFSKCEFLLITTSHLNTGFLEEVIDRLRNSAKENDVPIDGLVATYDDIAFSKSCGSTGHHYKDGMAFKFEDSLHDTILREFKWNTTRSGLISVKALFDPVFIDGCEVVHATLHNLTIVKELELTPGCRIKVSKRNMIIPHVEENMDRGRYTDSIIPSCCPCCSQSTHIKVTPDKKVKGRKIETLHCINVACEARTLRKFVHFVSKKAMNIEGLSTGTLDAFIEQGWLNTFLDVFLLDRYRDEIIQMDGFGAKSFDRMWSAIEASCDTTFERYLISMDIPMVGRTHSGILGEYFEGNLDAFEAAVDSGFDFSSIPRFGIKRHQNIHAWFREEENRLLWKELQKIMNIQNPTAATGAFAAPTDSGDSVFAGKTIVVTGKVEGYTRTTINARIASLGAIPADSVTAKTDYLVCTKDASSKLDKARKLGVKILTGQDFLEMIGNA